MIRALLFILTIFVTCTPVFSQKVSEVSLRFSFQDDTIRIVLESDKDTIDNANTIASLSDFKIDFPSSFILKKQKDFMFNTAKEGRLLIINLKDISEIKVFKLDMPSRLVIDLKTKEPLAHIPDRVYVKEHTVKLAVLDAGHGGYDYGLESSTAKEKDINLAFTSKLRRALLKEDRIVFLTRKTDRAITIDNRIIFTNSKNPDLFVSVHTSFSNGFVIYTSPIEDIHADITTKLYSQSYRQNRHIENSRAIAFAIGESIKSELEAEVVLREMPLPLLNAMDAPAILIELPMIHFVEQKPDMIAKVLSAILEGITAYEL
jgi:N-acetylmuramoyl-L-alanine amidase